MTRRTAWPAGPESYAAEFVSTAQRVVERCLANHPQVDRHQATLRLAVALGGSGWVVTVAGEVLDRGEDTMLAEAARSVIRSSVHALDVESQDRLLSRMIDANDPPPGSVAAHFKAVLVLTGEAWQLQVQAVARGTTATVATFDGVLDQVGASPPEPPGSLWGRPRLQPGHPPGRPARARWRPTW